MGVAGLVVVDVVVVVVVTVWWEGESSNPCLSSFWVSDDFSSIFLLVPIRSSKILVDVLLFS